MAKFSPDPFRSSIHHPPHCIIACSSALILTRSYLVCSSLLTALLINTSSSRKLGDSLAACSSFVHEFSLDSDLRSTYHERELRTIEISSNTQIWQYLHFLYCSKFENKGDLVINHLNFNFKHNDKY